MKIIFSVLVFFACMQCFIGCKTKDDVKREKELESIKSDVQDVKSLRNELEAFNDEVKSSIVRLSNEEIKKDEEFQNIKKNISKIQESFVGLEMRVKALEQKQLQDAENAQNMLLQKNKVTFDNIEDLMLDQNFDEACDMLRTMIKKVKNTNADDYKRARFMLGECLFQNKDFASSILEFSNYKKSYPKDKNNDFATYRQGQSFKSLGKNKEAKLFYDELVEKYPKSKYVAKVKKEIKNKKNIQKKND